MGGEIEFKGYEQDQGQLFPSHLSEALDADDSAFFINDFVEGDALPRLPDYAAGDTGTLTQCTRARLRHALAGAVDHVVEVELDDGRGAHRDT
jgi:hypothetical protein